MVDWKKRLALRPCTLAAGAFLLASTSVLVTAASAKDDDDEAPDGWSEKITNSIKDYVGGATSHMGFGKAPPPPPSEVSSGCPTVAILPGTEVQRVFIAGSTANPGLKYQFSLVSVGRECAVSGSRVAIRVGVDGRVLLGPAGQPGRFDVPIRVAVISEMQQKPVESRLFKVPVSVSAQQASAPFSFSSDSLQVTIPQGHSGEYSIKVGIDAGKGGDAAPKAKHARRHKGAPDAADQSASR